MALLSLHGLVILLRIFSASGIAQPSLKERSELPDAEASTPCHHSVTREEEEAPQCSHHDRAAKFCDIELSAPLRNTGCMEAGSAPSFCPSFSPLLNRNITGPICAKDQMPHCDEEFLRDGIRLTMDESCLNGQSRLVAEGFLSRRECSQIMQLSVSASHAKGDGNVAPRRSRDVHVWSADTKWLSEEMPRSTTSRAAAGMILTSSSKVRRYVEAYFRLRSRLHHQYSRLECHSAPKRARKGVDNAGSRIQEGSCQLQPNGSCAHAQRDTSSKWQHYGAVLFLNENFRGGHFVFVGRTGSSIRALVRPKCGRVVIFAGDQPHGYSPLTEGRGCRLVLGFTHAIEKRDEHWDALRSASRAKHASTRRLGQSSQGTPSRAFFVDRLRTSAPISLNARILFVSAGMAPIVLWYTCYFSYKFYIFYRWRQDNSGSQ